MLTNYQWAHICTALKDSLSIELERYTELGSIEMIKVRLVLNGETISEDECEIPWSNGPG